MSKIEVNTVDVQCGSTLTLGSSGKTVQLASGASQSGFGRTGTVDWQTGSIKTANFDAVSGQGFFCDTNGGAFTCTLPSGSAGAIVSLQDYRNTFDTANLTVTPQSGEKINGGEGSVVLSTEGEGITLVYIDSTIGWRSIQDNDFSKIGSTFINATGGTITSTPTCRIHTFTSPGTFCVSALAQAPANNAVGYLVVAGGGGGGQAIGGGGGAGGFREGRTNPITPYTASPLVTTGHTVSIQAYPITVGSGGSGVAPGSPGDGGDGNNSIFSSFTSAGGGGGAGNTRCGPDGGSGGGAGALRTGGTGNTPPVSPAQGTNGGNGGPTNSNPVGAGGGGGATAVGGNGSFPAAPGNNGGAGGTTHITGSPVAYAGGGGGANQNSTPQPSGGTGGGGKGGMCSTGTCMAGAANTGGGGGGAATGPVDAGNGGSGIVIIRYKIAQDIYDK